MFGKATVARGALAAACGRDFHPEPMGRSKVWEH